MPNTYFKFKQFTINQARTAMKVTTDGCLFGAWVAAQISKLKVPIEHVLDIGTGTGLLSLMIAQKNSLRIDAIEIDDAAATEARQNIQASPWAKTIHLINEDLLKWKPEKKYDCIVSNPPFYEGELKSDRFLKNIAHHDDGLKLKHLLTFIKNHLSNEGVFFLLLPAKRKDEIEQLVKASGLYLCQQLMVRQSTSHGIFRTMVMGSISKHEIIVTDSIPIKNNNQEYTPEFKELLQDYYLYI